MTLTTSYLGLKLKSPLVVSSNPWCNDLAQLERMEAAGAGAVVLVSLFEEQLTLQDSGMTFYRQQAGMLPDELKHIPDMEEYNKGAAGYLAHLYQAKKRLGIPVFASLNGSSRGGWIRHARVLDAAGADGIELNIYYLPTETHITAAELEDQYLRLVEAVKEAVNVPVAVKLSPYFTALPNLASRLADAGADGLVLFNRFYQPDFDIEKERVEPNLILSTPDELRLRLRWAALLHRQVEADLAITGGVHSAVDVVKAIMAGANVAMMASALLRYGIDHMEHVLTDLRAWLADHGHVDLDAIRGRLSQANVAAPAALARANYMHVLESGYSIAAERPGFVPQKWEDRER